MTFLKRGLPVKMPKPWPPRSLGPGPWAHGPGSKGPIGPKGPSAHGPGPIGPWPRANRPKGPPGIPRGDPPGIPRDPPWDPKGPPKITIF